MGRNLYQNIGYLDRHRDGRWRKSSGGLHAVTDKIEEIQDWIEGKEQDFLDMGGNLILALADGEGAVGDLIAAITSTIEGPYNGRKIFCTLNLHPRSSPTWGR
ncbi:MAG: hypothetical protein IPK53_03795 [bacterium]|nr:hypothetical protein [bacterium]